MSMIISDNEFLILTRKAGRQLRAILPKHYDDDPDGYYVRRRLLGALTDTGQLLEELPTYRFGHRRVFGAVFTCGAAVRVTLVWGKYPDGRAQMSPDGKRQMIFCTDVEVIEDNDDAGRT